MLMLLITQEPPLAPDGIATGNAIRSAQLTNALRNAGHRLRHIWLDTQKHSHADAFTSRDELQSRITNLGPDVILVAYWELLELLPFDLPQIVILDFVAPRPLEELFEHPEKVTDQLQRLHANLPKCDLLLTGNEDQRNLLWFSLLQAGFDLRGSEPILALPLAAEVAGKPLSDPREDGWTLVSGGVSWPWRQSNDYWRALQALQENSPDNSLQLVLFGGRYRWHNDQECQNAELPFQTRELVPYAQFSHFLGNSAHIGLELADPNIERKFSQSYRSLEFLRHGLPLICNDFMAIAKLVKQYNAGWTIRSAEDLAILLPKIMNDPDDWQKRSENAQQLVKAALNPDVVVQPLLEWLELPAKAPKLPHESSLPAPVVLGKPPWRQRLRHQAVLLRRVGLSRLIHAHAGDNILIVTRSDLFPTDHGAAVKIVATARALSQQGRDVGVISEDRRNWWLFKNGHEQRRKLPFWLRMLSPPRVWGQLSHLSKDLPECNSFLYLPLTDNSFFWHCLYVGKKLNAGILQAEFPAYAKPCLQAREILNAAVVLVEHNVEYGRLKTQVAELTDRQWRNLQAIEIDLCNRSDAVICVSDNDRQQLMNDGVNNRLLNTIPHGYDPEPFRLAARDNLRKKFKLSGDSVLLAFHGTFSYPPNRDALQVFADILLPMLQDAKQAYHLIAIGRNPPAQSLHPNIHFSGSVDQVGPWLKACDLAVIPLREGGGTRMKIIDCFAANLPVISTSKGIEGIPVSSGQEALICDDWAAMVAAIRRLSTSRTERERIAATALEFAAGLDWNNIAIRYLKIYSAIKRTSA